MAPGPNPPNKLITKSTNHRSPQVKLIPQVDADRPAANAVGDLFVVLVGAEGGKAHVVTHIGYDLAAGQFERKAAAKGEACFEAVVGKLFEVDPFLDGVEGAADRLLGRDAAGERIGDIRTGQSIVAPAVPLIAHLK